jgi:beta-mannosidase
LEKGLNKITIPFTLKNIKKWWPNGMGDQKLYDIQVSLSNQNYTTNSSKSIGLRTIELITEKDTIGNNFYFKINGIPTFMKGVNYIPQDVFTPRVKADDYEEILQSAVDANMNMVRVWGGGIYEEDIFYDLCDKYGLLVWQDFMFACAMYPGDEEFLNSVKEEAIYNVKRIRTHPSLALWCGNNEVLSAWENWGWKKSIINDQSQEIADKIYTSYDDLFHNILPNVIEKFDSDTAYWPSSPGSSFGKKESFTSGDAHYWGVWWGKEPFTNYENKIPRFMSEFGFQSFPDFTSVLKYTNDSDHNIYSEVMKSHQRSSIGNETIEEYMLREYSKPNSFKNFLYVSQLLQAEGISMGMEAHRRNRDICMGSLYWQLNDCWPVASWSSIDYYGKWKALHYKTRESFASNLISLHKKIDEFDIYYVTDSLVESNLKLNLEMIDFKGNLIKSWTKTFKSKPNNSKKVLSVNYKSLLLNDDFLRDKYIQAKVYSGNNLITKKTEYLTDFKNLNLIKPDFKYDVIINKEFFEISLISKNLVKNLFLTSSIDSNFSDNYFDLIPNEEKLIKIKREKFKSINNFKEGLSFISLYDTY